jgi:hypothetical protein
MSDSLRNVVAVLPADWPDAELEVKPGDLGQYAPIGLAMGAPMVLRPWDSLDDLHRQPGYYGGQGPTRDPFLDAPLNDAAAGTVYFDGTPERADFEALLRVLNVAARVEEYGVFLQDADDPLQQRYLTQMRVVCSWGLTSLFRVPADEVARSVSKQPVSLGKLLWKFIEDQQHTWGTRMGSHALRGVMGGDGDWAKEELAFGLMVENGYHGVFRIWSRAWLVTK